MFSAITAGQTSALGPSHARVCIFTSIVSGLKPSDLCPLTHEAGGLTHAGSWALPQFTQATAAAKRVFGLLDSVHERKEDGLTLADGARLKGDIAVTNAYFEYPTRPEGVCMCNSFVKGYVRLQLARGLGFTTRVA